MKKQTIRKWLKEANYQHIDRADFLRGSQFFEGDYSTKEMDEAEFQARMKMAKIRYKTKKYRKRPVEANAYQVKDDITITTPKGNAVLRRGDYLIYDKAGEAHPIGKEQFEAIYEPVSTGE